MAVAGVVAPPAAALGAGITFDGNFENGLTPWTSHGGGAQCANYGTPSKTPRLRGTFNLSSNEGEGSSGRSGQFTLPADPLPELYSLEACDLVTGPQPDILPSDAYYGLMVYVPSGWSIANSAFWGLGIEEFHFVNVVGAPVGLELHSDHVTIALETGACNTSSTVARGCQWRSSADNHGCRSTSAYTCLPGYYAIPPSRFVQGAWNEIILGVHWAADSSGQIQAWYRVRGAPSWNQASTISGHPTVQWDATRGCCVANFVDELEAYTPALSAPLNVWLDNDVVGTSFAAVAATMPGGPPPGGSGTGGSGGATGGGGRGAGGPGRHGNRLPALVALHASPARFSTSGRRVRGRCVGVTRANRRRARCLRQVVLRLRYRLSADATLALTLHRVGSGRRSRGRCVAAARGRPGARRCRLHIAMPGTWVLPARRGWHVLTFAVPSGRRRLAPGTYLLTVTPVGDGGVGAGRTVRFAVVR